MQRSTSSRNEGGPRRVGPPSAPFSGPIVPLSLTQNEGLRAYDLGESDEDLRIFQRLGGWIVESRESPEIFTAEQEDMIPYEIDPETIAKFRLDACDWLKKEFTTVANQMVCANIKTIVKTNTENWLALLKQYEERLKEQTAAYSRLLSKVMSEGAPELYHWNMVDQYDNFAAFEMLPLDFQRSLSVASELPSLKGLPSSLSPLAGVVKQAEGKSSKKKTEDGHSDPSLPQFPAYPSNSTSARPNQGPASQPAGGVVDVRRTGARPSLHSDLLPPVTISAKWTQTVFYTIFALINSLQTKKDTAGVPITRIKVVRYALRILVHVKDRHAHEFDQATFRSGNEAIAEKHGDPSSYYGYN